jgi:hypothetical protein
MEDSILTTIKGMLGLEVSDTSFDKEIAIYINGAIARLKQLAVGPDAGFSIKSVAETWANYLGNAENIGDIQTYIYLKVRLIFDPPTSSYVVDAIKEQIKELEWCLNADAEGVTSSEPATI